MASVHYSLEKVEDENLRQVLYNITRRLEENTLVDFVGEHRVFTLSPGIHVIPHYLGYRPADAWLSGFTISAGAGTVELNYDAFNSTTITVTVTGPVASTITVRMFLGRVLKRGNQ